MARSFTDTESIGVGRPGFPFPCSWIENVRRIACLASVELGRKGGAEAAGAHVFAEQTQILAAVAAPVWALRTVFNVGLASRGAEV